MANLVIKNNTGTASSITFDNKSGSDWKIINNNGTFTLNGKSTNWLTISDAGIAKFAGRVAIKMDPDTGSTENNFAASALSVSGAIAAYNGNIRAIRDDDSNVMLWCENTIGSIALMVHKDKKIMGLLHRRPKDQFLLWYDLTEDKYKQIGTTFVNSIYVNGNITVNNALTSTTTLYLNSAADTSLIFTQGGANTSHEVGRFNKYGSLSVGLNSSGTNYTGNTYKIVSYGPIRASDGNISAYSSTATERSLYAENSEGKVSLVVGSGGRRGIYNTLPDSKSHWMIYYDPTNERQQQTATYFTGTPYVANSTYWPSIWFSSSNIDESPMGRIAYGYRTENGTSYDWGRFLFYEYSYKTGTKTKLDYYERYLFPKVTADLTADTDYYVLTTKPSTQTFTMSRLRLTATTDAAADADNAVALIIGDRTGTHLAIDNNEIIAKTGPTATGTLSLNLGGGLVQVGGGGLTSSGVITAKSSLIVNNSTIGGNIHFTATRSTDDKAMGIINYYSSGSTSATAYNLSAFYFVQYSYKTGTYNRVDHWDRYRFPAVDADKTADHTYTILTTKSAVSVAQGGTGATTAAAARTNLGAAAASHTHGVGDLTAGALTMTRLKLSSTSAVKHLEFSRGSLNYITAPASGAVSFCTGGADLGEANSQMTIYGEYIKIRTPLALTTDCYGTSRPSSGSYTGQIFFEY